MTGGNMLVGHDDHNDDQDDVDDVLTPSPSGAPPRKGCQGRVRYQTVEY